MEAIVIQRNLSKEEEQHLLEKMRKGSVEIYAAAEVSALLKGIVKPLPEPPNEKKKEINFSIMERVLQFGDKPIDGKTITEHLMIDTASIWHFHKFRIYFALRNRLYEIEQIEQLKEKNTKIILYAYSDLQNYFKDQNEIEVIAGKKQKGKLNFATLFNYGIYFIIRTCLGFFQYFRIKKKKHLVIDHSIRQHCLDQETLQLRKGNYNLQYLFEKLKDDFIVIDDKEIPKPKAPESFRLTASLFSASRKTFFGEYILFLGLLSVRTRKLLQHYSTQLKLEYLEIKKQLTDSQDKMILDFLFSLHGSSMLFLFKFLAYKRFFENNHFRSVTSIDENSARIKSIMDAAKSQNIKAIGIQHGTIHELHPAYMFTQKDVKLGILPDYTMVWGEYWRRFLHEKGNYPERSLIPVGQIRTDIIPQLKDSTIIKIPEIEGKGRIVVFASQPQRDPMIRRLAAFDVFSAVKDLENVHLVVKLHPAEKNDFDYYRKIAAEAVCANYSILLKIDLYLLISQSDIVITCFSTVGAETIYFNKPLIILDHLKQDIQGYYREGIALQATNADELRKYVKQFLNGEAKLDKEAYQNYIEKYAYKIDGKVSERIIGFVEGLE